MEVSNAKTWKGIIHAHFWKKVSRRFRNSVSFIPISNSIYYSVRQQRIVFDRIFYFLLFSIISLRQFIAFHELNKIIYFTWMFAFSCKYNSMCHGGIIFIKTQIWTVNIWNTILFNSIFSVFYAIRSCGYVYIRISITSEEWFVERVWKLTNTCTTWGFGSTRQEYMYDMTYLVSIRIVVSLKIEKKVDSSAIESFLNRNFWISSSHCIYNFIFKYIPPTRSHKFYKI